MKLSYDPAKSDRNEQKRGLSFEKAGDFDFGTAIYWQDTRQDYPEGRDVALGCRDNRPHVIVFSDLDEGIRVISFRKANDREGRKHGFAQTLD